MSLRGMAEVLYRLNLSYIRPTYVLAKADKMKYEDFKTLIKLLNGEVVNISFEDESMIRDYQAIQKTWFLRGHQRKILTYGKYAGVNIIGVLNYSIGNVYCEEPER